MSTVKRFLFENRNFDPDYDPEADHSYDYDSDLEDGEEYEDDEDELEEDAPPPPPTFSEEELAQAQKSAFEDGKAQGLKEANAQFEHLISTALTQISAQMPNLFDAHSETVQKHETTAVDIARSVTKIIIPAYTKTHGADEVVHVVSKCLEPLRSEPRIIVKVHGDLRDDVHEKLVKIAEDIGFDGRVVVMPHDELVPGDCRLEWSEGGAERNSEEIWQQIDEIIERNLTPDGNQGETPS